MWEMLDEMCATSPEGYKTFIQKHLTEGARMFKPPQPVMVLHCKIAEVSSEDGLCPWITRLTIDPVTALEDWGYNQM